MAIDEGQMDFVVERCVDRSRSLMPFDEASDEFSARFEPLTGDALDDIARELGFSLPDALRALYGSVANGGFGPGYGLIGLRGGFLSDLGTDVVSDYRLRRLPDPDDAGWRWPDRLLAICHWGCAIYSCVDCGDPDGRVVRFDPNPVNGDWSIAWGVECDTLMGWMAAWLDGDELFESGTPRS